MTYTLAPRHYNGMKEVEEVYEKESLYTLPGHDDDDGARRAPV